ncbi:MAG: dihydropteroate synthase, partial [Rhodanobacteraceae bacterium]
MFDTSPALDCNGRALTLDRPRVCGIINVTEDSFSGDGLGVDIDAAVAQGVAMVEQGADMLDVGAESTRPGAAPVAEEAEVARVVPVIAALAERVHVPISVDTSKPEVMRAAVVAGAGFVNDVYALRRDGALDAAAELKVPVCLMHMQGEPRTMQDHPHYDDVVGEVHRFLAERVFACEMAGIDKRRVLVDPGFGFGKTLEHNLALLRALERFRDLAAGTLVGLSRKAMVGTLTGRAGGAGRAVGSAAAAMIAVQRGALVVRVHDVAATRDALAVWA